MQPRVADQLPQLAAVVTVNPKQPRCQIDVDEHRPAAGELGNPMELQADVAAELHRIAVARQGRQLTHDFDLDDAGPTSPLRNEVSTPSRRVAPCGVDLLGAEEPPSLRMNFGSDRADHSCKLGMWITSERFM